MRESNRGQTVCGTSVHNLGGNSGSFRIVTTMPSNNIISILFYFFIDGKSGFLRGEIFFFEILVDGLNIIQFSQSKNEGNPKLLVYLVIYGCYGVFPASIELKK